MLFSIAKTGTLVKFFTDNQDMNFGLLLLFTGGLLFARGSGEENNAAPKPPADGDMVTVTGVLVSVGNMPFPELALRDSAGELWYIGKDDVPKLRNAPEGTLTLRGRLRVIPMELADGKKLKDRRQLDKISIQGGP
jgi:hypothetical protein